MSDFIYNNDMTSTAHACDNSPKNSAASCHINDFRSESVLQKKLRQLAETRTDSNQVSQLTGDDEELPLQGKFQTIQKVDGLEEEEPLQGKFQTIQRADGLEEEEPLQGKFETIQKAEGLEEEEPLQGKFTGTLNPAQLKENESQPNDTGLPDNLKSGIENLSGLSLDNVNVHYNSDKPAQLQALAYAQGTDIHVAPGQEQHLPHEAWHVVQQMQGRVEPTVQMNDSVPVNDDAGLENEADVMGGRAL